MIRAALLAVALLAAPGGTAAERFAVVGGDAEAACLSTPHALPRLPMRVSLVVPSTGMRRMATVVARLPQACRRLATGDPHETFYALHLDGPAVTGAWLGVADFGGRPRASIRACTSSEGMHLTAWSGRPLQGRALWHAYVYLGYDVVSTCRRQETLDVSPR